MRGAREGRSVSAQAGGFSIAVLALAIIIVFGVYYVLTTYTSAYNRLSDYANTMTRPSLQLTYAGYNGSSVNFLLTDVGTAPVYIQSAYLTAQNTSFPAAVAMQPLPLSGELRAGQSVVVALDLGEPTVQELLWSFVPLSLDLVTDHGVIRVPLPPLNATVELTLAIPSYLAARGAVVSVVVKCPQYTVTSQPLIPATQSGEYVNVLVPLQVPAVGTCTIYAYASGYWDVLGTMGTFEEYSANNPSFVYGFAQYSTVSEYASAQLEPGEYLPITLSFPMFLPGVANPSPYSGNLGSYPYVLDFSWYFYPYFTTSQSVYEVVNEEDYVGAGYSLDNILQQNNVLSVQTSGSCGYGAQSYSTTPLTTSNLLYTGVTFYSYCNGKGNIVFKIPIALAQGDWVVVPVAGIFGSSEPLDITVGVYTPRGTSLANMTFTDVNNGDIQIAAPLHVIYQPLTSSTGVGTGLENYVVLNITSSSSNSFYVVLSKVVVLPANSTGFCIYSGIYLPYETIDAATGQLSVDADAVVNLWPNIQPSDYSNYLIFNNFGQSLTPLPQAQNTLQISSSGVDIVSGSTGLPTTGLFGGSAGSIASMFFGSDYVQSGVSISISATTSGVNGILLVVPYQAPYEPADLSNQLGLLASIYGPWLVDFSQWYAGTYDGAITFYPMLSGAFLYVSNTPLQGDVGYGQVTITISGLNPQQNPTILIPIDYVTTNNQPANPLVSLSGGSGQWTTITNSFYYGSIAYEGWDYPNPNIVGAVVGWGIIDVQPTTSSVTITITFPIKQTYLVFYIENGGAGFEYAFGYLFNIMGLIISPNLTANNITFLPEVYGLTYWPNTLPNSSLGMLLVAKPQPGVKRMSAVLMDAQSSQLWTISLDASKAPYYVIEPYGIQSAIARLSSLANLPNYQIAYATYNNYLALGQYYIMFPNEGDAPFTLVLYGATCKSSGGNGT